MRWQAVIGAIADGVFGAETDRLTRSWQAAHDLGADGIVGPQTWAAAGLLRLGEQVPVRRTVVSIVHFARAVVIAWGKELLGGVPTKEAVAVLWAQFIAETSNRHVWNWNLGNTKKTAYDGCDYHCLRGVWEGVSPAAARRLIESGQALPDKDPSHAAAVGPDRVSVLFEPPHPTTRFRAYSTLEAGVHAHLKVLKTCGHALVEATRGNLEGFALGLKRDPRTPADDYMTASMPAYVAAMRTPRAEFMRSTAYESGLEAAKEIQG